MALEAELTGLPCAEVFTSCGKTSPHELREEEFPFLHTLCVCAREAVRSGQPEANVRQLKAAALALRAIILTSLRKPMPATERLLRETAGAEFFKAMEGMRPEGVVAEFGASIIQEAGACQVGRGELAGFVARGIEYVYPLLMWVAVVGVGSEPEEL